MSDNMTKLELAACRHRLMLEVHTLKRENAQMREHAERDDRLQLMLMLAVVALAGLAAWLVITGG